MRFTALLANFAEVTHGLLHVEGAGWEHYAADAYPAQVSAFLAGIVEIDPDESGTLPVLAMSVASERSGEAVSMGSLIIDTMRPRPPDGLPLREPFAASFSFEAVRPGVFVVRLTASDGKHLVQLPFGVRPPGPPMPPPPVAR